MAFKVHRGELRASGSHEHTAVYHRDASSSILPPSSHYAMCFVKISDESPETVFLLQCLLCIIWDSVQYLFASCHILDFNNSLPCGVLPSTHTLYGNIHFLINQSHHCEVENPFFSQSEVVEQRNPIHLLCLIHYFLLFCHVSPYLSFH